MKSEEERIYKILKTRIMDNNWAVDDDDEQELWDEMSDEDDAADWDDEWEDPNEDNPESYEAIAIRLMDVLAENKLDVFVILKDPIVAEWWESVVKGRAQNAEKARILEEKRLKVEADEKARRDLLARLTPDEKRLLGIK